MTYPEPRKARPQVVPIRQVRPNTVRPLLQDSLNLSGYLQVFPSAPAPSFELLLNTCFILQMLEATAINMPELKMNIRVKYARFKE